MKTQKYQRKLSESIEVIAPLRMGGVYPNALIQMVTWIFATPLRYKITRYFSLKTVFVLFNTIVHFDAWYNNKSPIYLLLIYTIQPWQNATIRILEKKTVSCLEFRCRGGSHTRSINIWLRLTGPYLRVKHFHKHFIKNPTEK